MALVTAVWGKEHYATASEAPSLNLVYVDPDPSKTDVYGRQIGRDATSVPFRVDQKAPGYYWEE